MHNGGIENFDIFYMRFRDHLSSVNQHYIPILNLVEATNEAITADKLKNTKPIAGVHVHWSWINQHLWTTMAYFVDDTVLSRRLVYTQGIDWSGAPSILKEKAAPQRSL